jgi:hypothetical protein
MRASYSSACVEVDVDARRRRCTHTHTLMNTRTIEILSQSSWLILL